MAKAGEGGGGEEGEWCTMTPASLHLQMWSSEIHDAIPRDGGAITQRAVRCVK